MKEKTEIKKWASLFGLGLLAFMFSFQCSNNLFLTANTGIDSSVFKYIARVILDGGMPYRDSFDHKGPLIYLINVVGVYIAEWRGIWAVEVVFLLSTFFFMLKIAELQCDTGESLLIVLFTSSALFKYFEGGNLTEEYALPFIAVSIFIFVDYFINNKISGSRLIICGASFAAVCLLRINMIPIWLVMCISVLIEGIFKSNYRKLIKFTLFFIIGASIVAIPIMIWLIRGHAFSSFIECYSPAGLS